MRYIAKIEVNL